MKKEKLLLLSLFIVCSNFAYSQNIEGTAFIETNYLKLKDKNNNSEKTNIKESHWVNIWRNKKEIFDTKYHNQTSSLKVNANSVGLLATGKNVVIENSNEMLVNNGGIGMTVINNAYMENTVNGTINLNGNNEVGMLASKGTTGVNQGNIILNGGNNYTQAGMAAENGGHVVNKGNITINSESSYGMNAHEGGTIVNDNNINVSSNSWGIAMETTGDNSSSTNNGTIEIANSKISTGMVSAQGSISTNKGVISIKNSNESRGMNIGDGNSLSKGPTKIINEGSIALDKNTQNSFAMRVVAEEGLTMYNGQGINRGSINLNGANNMGMYAFGANTNITNEKDVILESNSTNSFGMVAFNGGKALNNGTIDIKAGTGKLNIGMQIVGKGTIGENNNIIKVSGNDASGLVAAQGGSANNNGEISIINGNNSRGMWIGDGGNVATTITNKKNITIDGSSKGSIAMSVHNVEGIMHNGLGKNEGKISVDGTLNRGMHAYGDNVSIQNNGDIILSDSTNSSFGMTVFNKAVGVNNKLIDLGNGIATGNMGIQVVGDNTVAINSETGTIKVNNTSQVGMNSAQGGTAINRGTIDVAPINVSSGNNASYAITVGKNSSGVNEGIINISGKATGMISENQEALNIKLINSKTGIINVNTDLGVAMSVISNSTMTNEGKITMNGSQNNAMYGTEIGNTITNNGVITTVGDSSFGIRFGNNSTVNNNGVIKMTGNKNNAIYIAGSGGVITTGNNSNIEMTGDSNFGIVATGELVKSEKHTINNGGVIKFKGNNNNGILAANAMVNNSGNIILDGDSNVGISVSASEVHNSGNITINGKSNTGIYASNNSKIYNTGTIDITGDNNTGIAIEANSSLLNKSNIILNGNASEITSGNTTSDGRGNVAIRNYGSIINEGSMIATGDFDTHAMGDGKFIMEKNSTLEADKIKGDIQLSSGITTGSLNNEYATYKMFNTKEMAGNLISNSYLFDVKLSNNENNYYDAVLTRKNFKDIVGNNSLANYLENNYVDSNNQNKVTFYDKFKLASNQQQLDFLVNDTFGVKTFPTIEKQTFEVIRLNEDILQSNISKASLKQDFGYIVGGAYNRIDSDSSSTTDGSMATLKNVWLGGEKKINNSLKYGLVFSIGDYDADFSNDSDRKDRMFQGTLFFSYDKNDVNARTFLTVGGTKTKLERDLKSYSEKLKSSFDSRYIVWTNEVSKKINTLYNTYLIPKLGFKLYRLSQDKLKENGQFGVALNKVDTVIMEPSVGFTLGKNIPLKNDYTFIPEIEMNYIHRAGDLKNNLTGKIESISNEQFELEGYKFKRNTGNMKVKLGLNKNDWTVFGSYRVMFERKVDSIGTVGINYKFN